MSKIKLITVSDDRSGRKGGAYAATQDLIQDKLQGWIDMKHYKLPDIIDCDPLMANIEGSKNGRVYKPWCILKELEAMEYGDYLIYNDCSPELWEADLNMDLFDLDVIRRLTDTANGILVGFVKWDTDYIPWGTLGRHTHRYFTPDNLLLSLGAEKYFDSFLCASGMICIRKSDSTLRTISKWLTLNRMPEYSCMNVDETEDSYYTGKPGSKFGHRHDQGILSLLLNERGWHYCAIQYNEMNPYNFLNYCRSGVDYSFINSNRSEIL